MTPKRQRMRGCSPQEAKQRLEQARCFLQAAKLTFEQQDEEIDYDNVTASLAVLASIAASDAACGRALGEYSREKDHKQAVQALERIKIGGKKAATDLDRVLQIKDQAHYGAITVSGNEVKAALRRAASLVDYASGILAR